MLVNRRAGIKKCRNTVRGLMNLKNKCSMINRDVKNKERMSINTFGHIKTNKEFLEKVTLDENN